MLTGTNYFPTVSAAYEYYFHQGYDTRAVNQKICCGEILIGKPQLKEGESLTTVDSGLRYGIMTGPRVSQSTGLTIRDWTGRVCNLSDQVYRVKIAGCHPLIVGVRVRLISGIDGQAKPGFHFTKGWVTVCPIEAKTAQFLGIKWKFLREAKD